MTLSSTSRQQRKSMLPKPRPSSRISVRRVTSSDTTSKIARRVPPPLLAATPYTDSLSGITTIQVRAAADRNLPLPEAGPRRAGSPLRIPWSVGQTRTSSDSCPTPEPSEALSSSFMGRTPSPEAKKSLRVDVNVQYPTPPASAEIRHERFFKAQEGQGQGRTTVPAAQHKDTENSDPSAMALAAAVLPTRHPSRRPASVSTALAFSRVDNASPRDGGVGIPSLAWKKSSSTSGSVSGKENQRPRICARVPPPSITSTSTPAPVPTIPPRSIRRIAVAQSLACASSFRDASPQSRPLTIRKQPPSAAVGGSTSVRSAAGASSVLPVTGSVSAGIRALIGDIDLFAKEWTEMFDELSVSAEDPEYRLSKMDTAIRIRPIGPSRTEDMGPLQVDNRAAGKGTLASINGETVHFDIMPASLTRWKHRDRFMVEDAPEEDKPDRDIPEVASASATDPQIDRRHHRVLLRNASLPTTPQASRHLPSLPETDQPSIISGLHLMETTSIVPPSRKDELANLPELPSTTPRGIGTARRNGIIQQARYYSSATVPSPFSPLSKVASLSSASSPYSSYPCVNPPAHDFATQRITIAASDAAVVPTRSSSLRGLRAIFKRRSAGLTSSHRQRAESLKERISEPRVLSLGSISISNLRDAGVASACVEPTGQEESTMMTAGDLTRVTTVK